MTTFKPLENVKVWTHETADLDNGPHVDIEYKSTRVRDADIAAANVSTALPFHLIDWEYDEKGYLAARGLLSEDNTSN